MRGGFWLGLVTGVLLSAVVLGLGARTAVQRGLTVEIEASSLSGPAGAAVEQAFRRELPRVTAEIRRRLPAEVAAELTRRFREAGIVVYGVRLELPEPAAEELRRHLEAELSRQLEAQLAPERIGGFVGEWSRDLERQLLDELARSLASRPVPVRPVDRLPLAIPVTIRLELPPYGSAAARDPILGGGAATLAPVPGGHASGSLPVPPGGNLGNRRPLLHPGGAPARAPVPPRPDDPGSPSL